MKGKLDNGYQKTDAWNVVLAVACLLAACSVRRWQKNRAEPARLSHVPGCLASPASLFVLTLNKGGIVSDAHSQHRSQIVHRQEQVRRQFRYAEGIPAALCLALCLVSGIAHGDDNALIREANAALSQKDFSGAFSRFLVLAQQGNATAQFNLGAFYLNGQGVQRDENQAYEWFAKSATQGHARAMQILQGAAAKGNEIAKNELDRIQQQSPSRQTQSPLQASSLSGDDKTLWAEANAALTNKDYVTALARYLVLAKQGNAIAQYNVGAFYLNGLGIQKDEKQAYDWFAKSAAQGYARAASVMQSAPANANEDARNSPDGLAQSATDAVPPLNDSDAKVRANADAHARVASQSRPERSRRSSSSDFSLGVNLGQTGKLTGINNSTSFGLLAGYKINSSFGIELAYNSLYRNAKADSWLSTAYPGTTGTFDLASVSVAGQYSYDLGRNFSLLGNLGVHKSSYKIKSSGNGSVSGSSSGLVIGVKVQYDLSESVGMRGGFDTYTERGGMSGNVTELGLAVITRF